MLACVLVLAQVGSSSITGVVSDASGAVVPGASVQAKNEDTGLMYNGATTDTGNYSFASLTPGRYTITVSKPGFENFVSVHNVLTVGQPLVVQATLKVGAANQEVQVESSYQRIDTTDATVSDVITAQQAVNLPLNGRNPLALLTLGARRGAAHELKHGFRHPRVRFSRPRAQRYYRRY